MFDIEKAIADWRREMRGAGIKSPVPLEELESHLRDEMERLLGSGLNEQQAFETAARTMGGPGALIKEFTKNERKLTNMKRTWIILASLFGTAFGGALVLPALAAWYRHGVLHLGPLLMGVTVALVSAAVTLYAAWALRGAAGRKWATAFAILALAFYTTPLVQSFFVGNADRTDWTVCILLAAGAVAFYGLCLSLLWRRDTATSALH